MTPRLHSSSDSNPQIARTTIHFGVTHAAQAILERCEAIVTGCNNSSVSKLFSPSEIRKTNDICLGFMKAVAESSQKELVENRPLFSRLRQTVLMTNRLLSDRILLVSSEMETINTAENWLFDELELHPNRIRIAARSGVLAIHQIDAILTNLFSAVRDGLALAEGKPSQKTKILETCLGASIAGILRQLTNLNQNSRRILKLERTNLYYSSGQDPAIKPKDGREIPPIRTAMVNHALTLIEKDPDLSAHAAARNVIRQYIGVPDAYQDIDTFAKQISRSRQR